MYLRRVSVGGTITCDEAQNRIRLEARYPYVPSLSPFSTLRLSTTETSANDVKVSVVENLKVPFTVN